MDLLVFNILIGLLVIIDMKNYDKQITPLAIIAGVYVLLINANNLVVCRIYGFYRVEQESMFYIFIFFLIIFIIDMFFGYLYRNTVQIDFNFSTRFKSYCSATSILFVGTFAYFVQFISLFLVYGLNIKGMNNGILGHLSSLAYIFGPISLDLALKTKKRYRIVISLLMNIMVLVISICFGGKYVIFINLTYFLLFFILKRDKKTNLRRLVKTVLMLALTALAAFIFIYYIVPRETGQYESTLDFVFEHMFGYLFGPIIANNYTMENAGGGNSTVPFTVFVNIGKAIVGDENYVNAANPFVFPISNYDYTNVSGIFGETAYNLGLGEAAIYVAVIFLIVNVFFYEYRAKNKFYLSFCYVSAITAFMFFCNFYSVSGVVLPLMLAIFVDVFSLCRIGNYHI